MSDFNEALSLSKSLVQPHWERHLLYLIQGKEKVISTGCYPSYLYMS